MHLKRFSVAIPLLAFVVNSAMSQGLLKGTVHESGTNNNLPNVFIRDNNNKQLTLTDKDGRFCLKYFRHGRYLLRIGHRYDSQFSVMHAIVTINPSGRPSSRVNYVWSYKCLYKDPSAIKLNSLARWRQASGQSTFGFSALSRYPCCSNTCNMDYKAHTFKAGYQTNDKLFYPLSKACAISVCARKCQPNSSWTKGFSIKP